ncbi:MAG TPA: amidohydrolase family protein, partial [Pyrinomonadaceae bacterium]
RSVLLADSKIAAVGRVNRQALESLGVEHEIVDADGCLVTPGWIDPHIHLLGGSGEEGFSTQTPEFFVSEIVRHGFTTVVGCLGVDTTTKTLPGLLARAKALKEEGLSAFVWTGGYNVPPTTLTGSVREDIMYVEEVIGAGEVAVSDERSTDPSPRELARLADDAHAGGMLSGKAGVTHFHVGEGESRLQPLRDLIDDYGTPPAWLYPTHVERSEALMLEAVELARRGSYVDVDTVEEDLHVWLRFYLEHGGPPGQLTVSSDASISSPRTLYRQVRACVLEHGFQLENVLPCVTSNAARVLKLAGKGELAEGKGADVLVMRRESLEIREVIAGGRRMVREGELVFREKFLEGSNRRVRLEGARAG